MKTLPALGPLALRGALGGVVSGFFFGPVMLATRIDSVGEAAVLRWLSGGGNALDPNLLRQGTWPRPVDLAQPASDILKHLQISVADYSTILPQTAANQDKRRNGQ
jgi:hypothetical protein